MVARYIQIWSYSPDAAPSKNVHKLNRLLQKCTEKGIRESGIRVHETLISLLRGWWSIPKDVGPLECMP